MTWNNFKDKAKKIDDVDIPRIGHIIGVREDEIHAVLDVEAGGKWFDKSGRPKMLFEPHIFYRQLGPGAKRDRAVKAGLARKRWKRDYPRDSYPRLRNAMSIDEEAALKSCSWGGPQIMGFNHKAAGYKNVQDMVRDFMEDAEFHLEGMVKFISKSDRMVKALQRISKLTRPSEPADWIDFAEPYNGRGFRKNRYHIKLAERHGWWRKKPDTPWSPNDPVPDPPREGRPELNWIETLLESLLKLFFKR